MRGSSTASSLDPNAVAPPAQINPGPPPSAAVSTLVALLRSHLRMDHHSILCQLHHPILVFPLVRLSFPPHLVLL